jgi:hypothetical protein
VDEWCWSISARSYRSDSRVPSSFFYYFAKYLKS